MWAARRHSLREGAPVSQQAQIPVVVALGSRATGQGDQTGFRQVVQL